MMFKSELKEESFCLFRHHCSLAFHISPLRGSGKEVEVTLIMLRTSLWLCPI